MKNLFFIAMLFWCISAYSQHWNYGIEVGYTNNKFQTKGLDSHPQSGFKVGGIIDYNFKSNILIETGIAYERKGGKLEGTTLASQKISKIEVSHADYLNIPVSVGYKVDIKNKISFIPQIGWFLNIGVQGSGQLSGIDNYNQPYTMGIDIFSAPSISQYRPFNRIDTGPIFCLNVQYKKVRLKCSYELGINSVHPIYGSPKNRTLGASVAYIL